MITTDRRKAGIDGAIPQRLPFPVKYSGKENIDRNNSANIGMYILIPEYLRQKTPDAAYVPVREGYVTSGLTVVRGKMIFATVTDAIGVFPFPARNDRVVSCWHTNSLSYSPVYRLFLFQLRHPLPKRASLLYTPVNPASHLRKTTGS